MNTGKTRHRFQLCSDAFLKSSAHWILGNYLITQCCVAKAEVLSVWKKKTHACFICKSSVNKNFQLWELHFYGAMSENRSE